MSACCLRVQATMRAVVRDVYGGPEVLRVEDVAVPVPGAEEVLLRVHAAAVDPLDWHFLRADPFVMRFMEGLRRPKHRVLGADVAGTVVAVGAKVPDLREGDEVFAEAKRGCFAEFVAVPGALVAPKPVNLSFEEAAAMPVAGLTALQAVRDWGKLRPGQRVMVNGAGGGVGHFAVQLARALGAGSVTGVCSTTKMDLVARLGADRVIDHTKEDATATGPYDLILDTAAHRPTREMLRALAPDGTYVLVGGSYSALFKALAFGRWMGSRHQRVVTGTSMPTKLDLLELKRHAEAGHVRPHISRSHPLAEVPAAIAELEAGHATGKIVIRVREN